MRSWFGDPERVFSSTRPDPRTKFPHTDGICTTILEYENDLRCVVIDDVWTGPAKEGGSGDVRIEWRIEGSTGWLSATLVGARTLYHPVDDAVRPEGRPGLPPIQPRRELVP